MKRTIFVTANLLALPLQLIPQDTTCPFKEEWTVLTESATATIYHACRRQCNKDFLHTASMYKVIPEKIASQHILAMERTMMEKYGIRYGDIILIEGTGKLDGTWQVQDTMNKRYAGQEKIDLMVPKTIRNGKWDNIRISVAGNPFTQHVHSIQMNQN